MRSDQITVIAALALGIAGCGGESETKPAAPKAPATLPAGLYQIASEVTLLQSTDKTPPATRLKVGDKAASKACVAADGTPDQAMFVEAGDKCTATSSYARSGRISVQYQCNRPGRGSLYPAADGNYTADGFEAVVNQSTTFSGSGDYRLTRHLTATRVGACPAGGAPKA